MSNERDGNPVWAATNARHGQGGAWLHAQPVMQHACMGRGWPSPISKGFELWPTHYYLLLLSTLTYPVALVHASTEAGPRLPAHWEGRRGGLLRGSHWYAPH